MERTFLRVAAWAALLAVLLAAMGCGSSTTARVRLVNGDSGSGSLDLLVGGKAAITGVAFQNASGYSPVSTGTETVGIATTGSTTPLTEQNSLINSGTDTTVLATTVSSLPVTVLIADDNSDANGGDFKLRVLNAAPSHNSLDVYIVVPGTDTTNLSPTIAGVGFQRASSYNQQVAGVYDIFYTLPNSKVPIASNRSVTLNAGQIRTAIVFDNADGSTTATLVADKN